LQFDNKSLLDAEIALVFSSQKKQRDGNPAESGRSDAIARSNNG
jgi:hypothetical protein